MPQQELTTDEIIQEAESLTKLIKNFETEVATLDGKRSTLYERLNEELGFEDTNQARTAMNEKEHQLQDLDNLIHSKWKELKERPEWKILTQKNSST